MPESDRADRRQTRAFSLSLTAGILILANATAVAAAATWAPELFPTLPGSSGNDPATLYTVAVVGLICGALVLLGAVLLRIRPALRRGWGVMIVVFSAPSVVTGGGFIIGFIIGIIGGAYALSREHESDS
jgi:hypothetical protein